MSEYYFEDDDGNVRVAPIGDHRERGRCSGIPECCIEHFVNVVVAGTHAPAPYAWGYRPCPECVRVGNRVVVRDCAADNGARCTCGTWASSKIVEDA